MIQDSAMVLSSQTLATGFMVLYNMPKYLFPYKFYILIALEGNNCGDNLVFFIIFALNVSCG